MSVKLHNAMWPGLVGKEAGTDQPPILLDRMLELTLGAKVGDGRFDGVDLFLFHPHIDPFASADEIVKLGENITSRGLQVGSLVAPVWPGTVGGCAFGSKQERSDFLKAVKLSCEFGARLRAAGARNYGCIRIDSAGPPEEFVKDEAGNTKLLAETFREAGKIAADHGERLAAEGEICWGGMHSWKQMLTTLEATGMPEVVGFQADLAHTYLYLLGHNAPDHALLDEDYSDAEFWEAYKTMTDALRPWTFDFHVAQNDGSVHGTGSHDNTGRHCPADDPNGRIDIVKCSSYWLRNREAHGIEHICWDGCMFDNGILESSHTWNAILGVMLDVQALLETETTQ